MNAYELADELQELDSKLHLINLFKSANMLRQQEYRNIAQCDRIAILEAQNKQQADRIAELEEQIKENKDAFYEGVGHGYLKGLEKQETQTNAETVAWMDKDGNVYSSPLVAMRNQCKTDLIPLYTTPQTKDKE